MSRCFVFSSHFDYKIFSSSFIFFKLLPLRNIPLKAEEHKKWFFYIKSFKIKPPLRKIMIIKIVFTPLPFLTAALGSLAFPVAAALLVPLSSTHPPRGLNLTLAKLYKNFLTNQSYPPILPFVASALSPLVCSSLSAWPPSVLKPQRSAHNIYLNAFKENYDRIAYFICPCTSLTESLAGNIYELVFFLEYSTAFSTHIHRVELFKVTGFLLNA